MTKALAYLYKNKIARTFILYIFSTLVFAFIYYFLPANSFYHSTIQFESNYFKNDINKITLLLTQKLGDTVRANAPKNIKIIKFNVASISFDDYPKDTKLNVHFEIEYTSEEKSKKEIGFNDLITLNLSNYIKFDNKIFVYYSYLQGNSFLTNEVLPLIDYYSFFSGRSTMRNLILIDDNIYTKLNNIGNAYRGFPKELSGQFIRMLYLSIGVATTMTFGDILPITNTARFIIIIQNIFTLIFISLFIDAIIGIIKKQET
jgi:hypothetical protein